MDVTSSFAKKSNEVTIKSTDITATSYQPILNEHRYQVCIHVKPNDTQRLSTLCSPLSFDEHFHWKK